MFFGLGVYYLAHNGLYPVIIVNSKFIFQRTFEKEFQAAAVYYQNALRTYSGNSNLNREDLRGFFQEIRRAALDNLIENTLIYNELQRRAGKALNEIVDKKLPAFKESAVALYGMTAEEFKKMVLIPQARREVLEGRFLLEKQDFAEWLFKEKQDAQIYILLPQFNWDGSQVAVK